MGWTTPKDLKAQLARLWERGELLRDIVTGNERFPFRLTLKGPSSADVTDRFEAVRAWIEILTSSTPLRVEWQEVRHRIQGLQRLPSAVWVDSLADVLSWLGRRQDWTRFCDQIALSQHIEPGVLPWLAKRPLQALELAGDWPRLLAVVEWLKAHPRPGIYLRQVDMPGVHSKFIEAHRTVLADLFDLTLPAGSVDATKTGVAQFALRYGFLEKPTRIRFRILDPGIRSVPGTLCPDITLDADSFSHVVLDVHHVFITENETNFLALPNVLGGMVIFGAGYGWEALAKAKWLEQSAIYYWGDIDTHGFAILDQLRSHFGHVTSFLMDRATLETHRPLWGVEDRPSLVDLGRLTPEEFDLYDALRDNRIREGLRLEQEHIAFSWVRDRLDEVLR